jgi:hypothetical protein
MEMARIPNPLLVCLRSHGQRIDFEIAQETGVPLGDVRAYFAGLLASGDVIACKLTRYDGGEPIDSMIYRVCGYAPRFGRGRKPASVVAAGAGPTPDAFMQ